MDPSDVFKVIDLFESDNLDKIPNVLPLVPSKLLSISKDVFHYLCRLLVIPKTDVVVEGHFEAWKDGKRYVCDGGNYRTNFYFGMHPITAQHYYLRALAQVCRTLNRRVTKFRSDDKSSKWGRYGCYDILRVEKLITMQNSKHSRCLRRLKRKSLKKARYYAVLNDVFTEIKAQFENTLEYKKFQAKPHSAWFDPEFAARINRKGHQWYFMARIPATQKFGELRMDQIVLCGDVDNKEYFWVMISRHFCAKVKFHLENECFVFTIRLSGAEYKHQPWIEADTDHERMPKQKNANFPPKKQKRHVR